MNKTWPEILRLAEEKGAMILFGDEASFAQWGSLSYPWARKGKQPTVKTTGIRKAYKIRGLIDFLSGAFFYKAHTGRFNSETYQAFLREVLKKTDQHLIVIQAGARYPTSKAMNYSLPNMLSASPSTRCRVIHRIIIQLSIFGEM
jgi:hypothetical protein